MPIPDSDIQFAEIAVSGLMTAGGSASITTYNIFHYRRTNSPAAASKAQLEAAFYASVSAALILALNARWTYEFNAVRWINDPNDPYVDFAHNDPGNVAGDSMPSDQAAFMLLRTNLRGRSFKGSKHFAPMSESGTTTAGDVFNAGALTLLTDLATAMAAPLTDAGGNVWNPAVVSRKLSSLALLPVAYVRGEDVTQIKVNHRVGSMLRRKTRSVY